MIILRKSLLKTFAILTLNGTLFLNYTPTSFAKNDNGYNAKYYSWQTNEKYHSIVNKVKPELKKFPIKEFTEKFNQAYWHKTNVRIEDGLLKINPIEAKLAPSQITDRIVNETLTLFGYTIIQGHTMENVECDFRLCFGTKVYTIGEIDK